MLALKAYIQDQNTSAIRNALGLYRNSLDWFNYVIQMCLYIRLLWSNDLKCQFTHHNASCYISLIPALADPIMGKIISSVARIDCLFISENKS